MAGYSGRASLLDAARRSDLLGGSSSGGQGYGEEFSEEDVWGAGEESEVEAREPTAGSRPISDTIPLPQPAGRVINRSGWGMNPKPLMSLGRNQFLPREPDRGLSALAAEGMRQSGPGPGTAGDIIGSSSGKSVMATPSVGIRQAVNKADALRPMRRASAPVNVPDWNKVTGSTHRLANPLTSDDEDDDTVIPPHELIARECAKSVTFSVYEGVGRTLRGRDMEHVRTAVLRKTGFLDT